MPKIIVLSIFVTLLFIFNFRSPAQAQSDCENTLVMQTVKSSSSSSKIWELAQLVDSQTYTELSHGASANAEIFDVPVGASYEDFEKNIDAFKQANNVDLSDSEVNSIALANLHPNSVPIYRACLEAVVMNSVGLHAEELAASQSDITILVRWFVPSDTTKAQIAAGAPTKKGWCSLQDVSNLLGGGTLVQGVQFPLTQLSATSGSLQNLHPTDVSAISGQTIKFCGFRDGGPNDGNNYVMMLRATFEYVLPSKPPSQH